MNIHDRDTFNGAMSVILKGIGDELGSKLRRGLDYFREVELEAEKLKLENELLKSDISRLEGQLKYLKSANKSTEHLPVPSISEVVEPPKIPKPPKNIAMSENSENGVLRPNEDNVETARLEPVQKKSILARWFGR
jgi:hypothetical protein